MLISSLTVVSCKFVNINILCIKQISFKKSVQVNYINDTSKDIITVLVNNYRRVYQGQPRTGRLDTTSPSALDHPLFQSCH